MVACTLLTFTTSSVTPECAPVTPETLCHIYFHAHNFKRKEPFSAECCKNLLQLTRRRFPSFQNHHVEHVFTEPLGFFELFRSLLRPLVTSVQRNSAASTVVHERQQVRERNQSSGATIAERGRTRRDGDQACLAFCQELFTKAPVRD